ncbi:BTB/POZ domain-containing protein 6-B-like [Oculina patagonica]
MAVFEEEWQKTKASIKDRSVFMFNNELLSDVSLVVRVTSDEGKPKKSKMAIPAHKLVLSMCSPVFFAMFFGELAEKSDSVYLPDCDYEGVLEMLRYMYSGRAELNESNVIQVLYLAKKYMVNSLADECVLLLRKKLDSANVFCVLSHAQQYDENTLVDECWKVVDSETVEALKSEGFTTIERSLLEAVVKRDTLTIREVELFKAVDLWATKECERQVLTPDGNAKRRILGETIVEQIRFPVMEQREFASVVLDSEILTPQQVFNMMKHFNSVLTSPVGFKGNERVGTLRSCFRFTSVYRECCGSKASNDCLHFHVNKDIILHGICLFGSENNEHKVTLTVKEIHGDAEIVNKSGNFSSFVQHSKDIRYYGFVVMFDPVNLMRDKQYSVQVKMNSPRLYCGYNLYGDEGVKSQGVKFFFRNSENSSGGTTTALHGQFADFFFMLP